MPNPILEDIVVHDSIPSPIQVMMAHENPIDFGVVEVMDHPHSHEDRPQEELVIELHGDDMDGLSVEPAEEYEDVPEGADIVVTSDDEPVLAIDLGDLPGAPDGTPDPEEEKSDEEVTESSDKESNSTSDTNKVEDKPSKKSDRWDWKSHGLGQFTFWVKERFDSVPKHSGYSTAGLERARAYLERLHGEISKAMRADIDGELDSDIIADIHEKIEEGIEKLDSRLEKVKGGKKKKRADEDQDGIVKEAQKIFGVQNGIVITVPLFISSLARALVNGTVSAGRDIEHSYDLIVNKYRLSDREKMELIQLVQDMGFPTIRDRSLLPEEVLHPESTDNVDFSANYQA